MAVPGLPADFLGTPAPNIEVKRIDWTQTPLTRYNGLYAVVIDNALSQEECTALLAAAEETTGGEWKRAMVNVGGGRQELISDARNCGRIIWDSHEVVAKLWSRIAHLTEVQEIMRLANVPRIFGNGPMMRKETWSFTRPNERMRFLKYIGGEYFRPHEDGTYETPDGKERTYFTLHLYLNGRPSKEQLASMTAKEKRNAVHQRLEGGATTFHDYGMTHQHDVYPKPGRILLFQHRGLLHSGDDVLQGVKYTMRTDLLYEVEKSGRGKKRQ